MPELHQLFGSTSSITWWQMVLRAVLIFCYLLLLLRLGPTRAFGKLTAFDTVVGVTLGSTLSRCLTGNSPLLPTMAASGALVLLHGVLGKLSVRWPALGHVIKGAEVQLVKDGQPLPDAMRRVSVTEHDLHEGLRSSGGVDDLSSVRAAYLERSGKISVVK